MSQRRPTSRGTTSRALMSSLRGASSPAAPAVRARPSLEQIVPGGKVAGKIGGAAKVVERCGKSLRAGKVWEMWGKYEISRTFPWRQNLGQCAVQATSGRSQPRWANTRAPFALDHIFLLVGHVFSFSPDLLSFIRRNQWQHASSRPANMPPFKSPYPPIIVRDESYATYLFRNEHKFSADSPAYVDGITGQTTTRWAQRTQAIALARSLRNAHQAGLLPLRRGSGVIVFSPNSLLYPVVMMAMVRVQRFLSYAGRSRSV